MPLGGGGVAGGPIAIGVLVVGGGIILSTDQTGGSSDDQWERLFNFGDGGSDDESEADDPHGIEDEMGYSLEELGQFVEGHTPEDRFGEEVKEGKVAAEVEEALRNPGSQVKPGNAGPWVRDEKRQRTIMLNKEKPWKSTAVTESKTRWDRR